MQIQDGTLKIDIPKIAARKFTYYQGAIIDYVNFLRKETDFKTFKGKLNQTL